MKEKINSLINELNKGILGNEKQIILAVICLLSRGHLLIEDLPGTGKSTLSKALAKCFGLDSKSVHFTSDLLPSDLIGINIFDSKKSSFRAYNRCISSHSDLLLIISNKLYVY